MERTAQEVAKLLTEIYDESFGNTESDKYKLSWSDLRALAGVRKLKDSFIAEINVSLTASFFALAVFADFLLVTYEKDFDYDRTLPGQLVERYLPDDDDADEDVEDDEEFEDD